MHWNLVIAHLYPEQICIGLIAVAQDSCQLCLHSSAEQHGHFALKPAAEHSCLVIVHRCPEQICIGVIAVAQESCQLDLLSRELKHLTAGYVVFCNHAYGYLIMPGLLRLSSTQALHSKRCPQPNPAALNAQAGLVLLCKQTFEYLIM